MVVEEGYMEGYMEVLQKEAAMEDMEVAQEPMVEAVVPEARAVEALVLEDRAVEAVVPEDRAVLPANKVEASEDKLAKVVE